MGADGLRFAGVSKVYRLYAAPRDRLLEVVTGKPRHAEVHALRNVSGGVAGGSVLGLIGENGSGKSTLFKILAGTTTATAGEIFVPGRVASVLELGSAFHPEESGRRNVMLQAAFSGLTRDEVRAALPEIEAFAELGEFFDRPVKTFSSGMQMRLAFAVATAVLPDVVILDEALAVGDGRFQKKCIDRILELKASGRTIFFCSHAMYYVSTICDEAIWLRAGEVAASGDARKVVLAYEKYLAGKEESRGPHAGPHGGTHARFLDVRVVGADGSPRAEFRPGEPWAVELSFAPDEPSRPLQIHLAVSTRDNVVCFSADSRLDGTGPFTGKERYRVRVGLDTLPLGKGEFVVYAYIGDENALALYDARSDQTFHVESPSWRSGLMAVPATWTRLGSE
ncbi:MAG TPA: ABC transporter ATP-binding protein [Thermoanaerobaculia bacterium]|nr:ABC transporter ATP-binding protein [Thermoanaerobaculia bacterium]